jgi:two-component system sensor histidine kinase YesM
MRIGARIAYSYFLVVIVSVLLSILVFWRWISSATQAQVNEAAAQTLAAVRINFGLTLNNAHNYSNVIFSDNNLQSLLRQGSIYSDLQKQAQMSGYLYNLIQAVPVVDSVYVFDTTGNIYSVGKHQPPPFLPEKIEQAPWYGEAVAGRGGNIFRRNAGGALGGSAEPENYVSLIRMIRDLDDTSPLGILMLNIPESALAATFEGAIDDPAASVYILDPENVLITAKTNEASISSEDFYRLSQELERRGSAEARSDSFTWHTGAKEYFVSFMAEERYGCRFIGLTPSGSAPSGITATLFIVGLILLLNGAVLFAASMIISRTVTEPVRQLLQAMDNSGKGEFEAVPTQGGILEFQQLFDGYNMLIARLKRLVQNVVEEQTAYRKAELHALQVQIKPHFLYNTLDSILSLNLSGRIDESCRLLEALGSYYRTSVSKGGEVITIGQEIEMVENYMIIQNIRYQDLVQMEYDIAPEALGLPVLKMVLQPLVENALYHGIRPKGSRGTVRVSARCEETRTVLRVEDDGLGIGPERLEKLLRPPKAGEGNSFGLWGTLERIRIFYGVADCYRIESAPGEGTAVTLFLAKEW